jgi:putative aldouronate transport system permease protein
LNSVITPKIKTGFRKIPLIKNIIRNYDLYLLSLPVLAYYIIFRYVPMYGVQLAFKNFRAVDGIWGSPWIGFEQFLRFFRSANFWNLIRNTLSISIYSLAVGFPLPVLLALMLNEVRHKRFKKTVQMVTYAPHFISTVVIVGMMNIFLTPGTGIVNKFFDVLGLEYIPFLSKPEWFQTLYVFSGVWQNCGWSSIIYMSVLSSVDIQLYEAARVDGATKLQKMVHIDLPSIVPTMVILFILNMGGLMNVGFEKVFLMQNPLNMRTGDVISTYVYRVGLIDGDFSFSTAVGLFNSVINFILLVSVNTVSKKLGNNSLW